ncbi:MAG: DUF2066 domain-containing protein [Gammaproteobacteria bacterium]|nr:DUF2066 domain-containing protein [Gammaproteobacteria bacterium]MDH5731702.1 DUF2066 domain-containing protein [Gammaproteobacteria bacterium]
MKIFTFLILLVFFPVLSHATKVKNLYEVKWPILTQNPKERTEAINMAFDELMIRITGDQAISTQPLAAELYENAQKFVRQFRYEPMPIPDYIDTEMLDPEDPLLQQRQQISILFDEQALKDTIWQKQLPIWGEIRPNTLVWLAIQNDRSRILFDGNQPSEIRYQLRQIAKKRGIPMVFPLLDLQDQIAINVNDVWGNFAEPIQQASMRYDAEAVLSGRVMQEATGAWQVRWVMYQADQMPIAWTAQVADLSLLASSGIDGVANSLAQKYAHISSGGADNDILLRVVGIHSLKDYARASRYVESLSLISKLHVSQIDADKIVFRIGLRSNRKDLEQAISLSDVLRPQSLDEQEQMIATERLMNYRLQP